MENSRCFIGYKECGCVPTVVEDCGDNADLALELKQMALDELTIDIMPSILAKRLFGRCDKHKDKPSIEITM